MVSNVAMKESRKKELVEENALLRQEMVETCENLQPVVAVVEQSFTIARFMIRARSITAPLHRLVQCGNWNEIPSQVIKLFLKSRA